MFVLLAMFGAGLAHGLGPDHLAAIAALVGRGTERRVARRELAWLGLRFGVGHLTTLLVLAAVAWTLGSNLPGRWQRGLELAGGVVLIFLGGWILAQVARRKVVVHSHAHTHDGAPHEHVHVHLAGRPHAAHRHPHLATLVGGLLGLSGAQSLLLLLPLVVAGSLLTALTRVAAFSLGILVSMTAVGWLTHAGMTRLARTPAYGRLLAGATGMLCAALGFYWLAHFAR